jgi:hypothetical protein
VIIGGSRQQQPQPATGRLGDPESGQQDRRPARRPWWVWAAPFAVLTALLVARNWFLFSTKLYEEGDQASNPAGHVLARVNDGRLTAGWSK